MARVVSIADRLVGEGQPTFVVGEIGINHNGSLETAKQLIDAAIASGCDAVKFQKRTPHLCVPAPQQNVMRETPWGYISYLEYRKRVEFGRKEFDEISRHCKKRGILWFSSCWDEASIDFIERYDPPCFKIQSAALTDRRLLASLRATGRPLILSTGMSTQEQIHEAVGFLGMDNLIICHTTSTYPCPPEELNLRMIQRLAEMFTCPIGYSGHEVGLVPSVIAVALGACLVERHITLDRATWGSDQAASVEPVGLTRLIKYIRTVEVALGDGVKRVYDSEIPVMRRLRRAPEETKVETERTPASS